MVVISMALDVEASEVAVSVVTTGTTKSTTPLLKSESSESVHVAHYLYVTLRRVSILVVQGQSDCMNRRPLIFERLVVLTLAIHSMRRIVKMYVACSRSMARYGLSLISLPTAGWYS